MSQRSATVSLLCGLILTCLAAGAAEPSAPRLVRQTYEGALGERDVYVYLPAGYDSDAGRRWPLLMFLHGDGERGDAKKDLDWVLAHGPVYEAWIYKRDLPFVIVSPQLPLFGRDETVGYIRDRDPATIPRRLDDGVPPRPEEFPTPEPMAGAPADPELPTGPEGPPDGWYRLEDDLLKIVDQASKIYRTDPQRVYLTGLSYGGFGTWYLASRHPERFAAIAPVVGWGHPDLMAPLAERRMPVWAFAGGRDPVVRVKHFYPGLNKLEELGHDDVRFTVHEDRGHDVWRRIYAGQDLYDWLLSHRRNTATSHTPAGDRQGVVYLTFDDGPIDATDGILDVLARTGVRATFFINGIHLTGEGGENEANALAALERTLAEGHLVGNHSWDHMLHNCCDGAECGAVVCNRIKAWNIDSYRDLDTDLAAFLPGNLTPVRERLSRVWENERLDRLARLPYTNAWRAAGLDVDCPCCTTDEVAPWDPASGCSEENPSRSARLSAAVADALAERGVEVFGWDLEWSPESWDDPEPVRTLTGAEALAGAVVQAMEGCPPTADQPAHTRPSSFPCEAPARQGRVVLLTHDFLFEDGSRGPGATLNLPKLERLIELLRERGYTFDTLDRYRAPAGGV